MINKYGICFIALCITLTKPNINNTDTPQKASAGGTAGLPQADKPGFSLNIRVFGR